jgi:hypothetical protein
MEELPDACRCPKCGYKVKFMVKVGEYLGEDADFGHMYDESWWCLPCLQDESGYD